MAGWKNILSSTIPQYTLTDQCHSDRQAVNAMEILGNQKALVNPQRTTADIWQTHYPTQRRHSQKTRHTSDEDRQEKSSQITYGTYFIQEKKRRMQDERGEA
ncbi:uncharacterized protein LOC144003186 [Festucalex cinctus]